MRRDRSQAISARMNATLEERVTALEKELAELRKLTLDGIALPPKDAWLESFGWAKDDPDYAEAMRLGAEWRARENADRPDAGS